MRSSTRSTKGKLPSYLSEFLLPSSSQNAVTIANMAESEDELSQSREELEDTLQNNEDVEKDKLQLLVENLSQRFLKLEMSLKSTNAKLSETEKERDELKQQLQNQQRTSTTHTLPITEPIASTLVSSLPILHYTNVGSNIRENVTSSVVYTIPQPTTTLYNSRPTTSIVPTHNQFTATPFFTPTASVHGNTQQQETRRTLHDLPEFTGQPEEWPLFITTFRESSSAYGYTMLENTFRLQKSLKKDAREAVESLLIHPNNVPQVLEQLEFRFGRAEYLIKSQIAKVRQFPVIIESRMEQIIPFATKVQNLVSFLRSSNANQHLANPTLMEELILKLPLSKRMEWAKYSFHIKPFPTLEHLSKWINDDARIICSVMPNAMGIHTSPPTIYQRSQIPEGRQYKGRNNTLLHAVEIKCPKCNGGHKLLNCIDFQKTDWKLRWDFVKKMKLCFSCLRSGHQTSKCRLKKACDLDGCQRLHNRLLHDVDQKEDEIKERDEGSEPVYQPNTKIKPILSCHNADISNKDNPTLLFRVVPVKLSGPSGQVYSHAFLDEGSSITLIDEEIAGTIGATGVSEPLTLQWFGEHATTERSMYVNVDICGVGEHCRNITLHNVRTVKNLSLPTQTLHLNELQSKYSHIRQLPIIDYSNAAPKILIGLDNYRLGIAKRTSERQGGPIAAKTALGWVIYGSTSKQSQTNHISLHISQVSEDRLHRLVEDYFAIEEVSTYGSAKVIESNKDSRAREILSKTTRRISADRFETGLLWSKDNIVLPNSYAMAFRRLCCIEQKIKRDPGLAIEYERNLMDFVHKGYARKLTPDEASKIGPRTWYLPHFGVRSQHKPEKLRLVFDAAAAVKGVSLNTVLLKGPDYNQPLIHVLCKFREGAVAVCADIKEMFCQIIIRQEDRDAQRFLWRHQNSTRAVDTYVMQSMTFGATCSPCSAQYVKNINAHQYKDIHPEAVKLITDNHYVDDFVASFSDEAKAVARSSTVQEIHRSAGFELRGFVSSSSVVESALTGKKIRERNEFLKEMNMEPRPSTDKILGMYWDSVKDELVFKLTFHRVAPEVVSGSRRPTKREVLSIVMSVFDPFGLLANFLIYSKIIIQDLWRTGTLWDEILPDEIYTKWSHWYRELKNVDSFRVPRCYSSHLLPNSGDLELHIFVDASEIAYAAVGYWRIVTQDGVWVCFVAGRAKCAPKKLLSIPRLELQAAVLGTRLRSLILSSHSVAVRRCILWTDSRTVSSWIKSDARRYQPFVAHRITEILETTSEADWCWVPTKDNAADEATRTKYLPRFSSDNRWIQGPEFLRSRESFTPTSVNKEEEFECQEELRKCYLQLHIRDKEKEVINFDKFSDYLRLKRVLAWVMRFVVNTKMRSRRPKQQCSNGDLIVSELLNAEMLLCRVVQRQIYAEEVRLIEKGESISKSSSIYQLTPVLDENGLLRLGGRIDAAFCIPETTRRPIIMPRKHKLTQMIIMRYHKDLYHQNQELIICEIRQRFWIPHLRSAVKHAKASCQQCKNDCTLPMTPLMGQLPPDRLTPFVRPFTYCGLDYFGPIEVAIGRRREKRWAALFTCLTIRAIHIELASDLSSDACILCIRNFINRRGVPLRIRSDNGTNFVGAKNDLQLHRTLFDYDQIQAELANRGIEWIFNCPSNPSAGGCWERLVHTVKRVLAYTLKESAPRLETLQSLLIEAENVVNSRPLTHLPVSSMEAEPLTPNHFLLGTMNSTQTPINDENLCLRKQYRIAMQLKNKLWKRWIREYLPDLTRRTKWFRREQPLTIGDLVLICDADLPRSQWRKGIVTDVFPGKDGQVRVAEIKTSRGSLKRPVSKLAVLDVSSSEAEGSLPGGRDVADRNMNEN